MNEQLLIYLTDSFVSLYDGSLLKPKFSEKNFEKELDEVQSQIKAFPNIKLKLLIDCSVQDFQEEKLPFLLPWDYLRYMAHKKRAQQLQKGLIYSHSFKSNKDRFFRSLHISQNDPLYSWIVWFNTLDNINKKIIYIPFEAEKFIKKHVSNPKKYQLLIYPIAKNQFRHVFYNGPRLLLSRTSSESEAFKSSLHYLSRKFPDIYDNLSTLSLSENMVGSFSDVKVLADKQSLIKFMSNLKKTTIQFEAPTSRKKSYAYIFLIVSVLLGTYFLYEGVHYNRKMNQYLREIEKGKPNSHQLSSTALSPNSAIYRNGIQAFQWLKNSNKNPLDTIKKLSTLFPSKLLELQSFTWLNHHSKVSLVFDINLNEKNNVAISTYVRALMNTLRKIFPHSHVRVLKAPFNSGPDETYNVYLKDTESSKVQIKVTLP